MVDEIKVALVGIGGYGELYATELFRSAVNYAVRFVAGIDPFAKSSKVFNEFQQHNVPVFENLEQFYEDDFADLVIVSAPISMVDMSPIITKGKPLTMLFLPVSFMLSGGGAVKPTKCIWKSILFCPFPALTTPTNGTTRVNAIRKTSGIEIFLFIFSPPPDGLDRILVSDLFKYMIAVYVDKILVGVLAPTYLL